MTKARFINENSIDRYNGRWFEADGINYSNPTDEQLAAVGYMEVTEGNIPDGDYIERYEVVDGVIVAHYDAVESEEA